MATDNTPPRLRLIVTIALIVVITLVALDFVFRGYYAYMTDEARAEKVAPKTALLAQVAAEQASLSGAKVPIDQAMKQVIQGTRPDLIEPKPSEDTGALTGWSKLPKPLPATMTDKAPGDRLADPMAADGGAMMAADGGAMMAADGGAPITDASAPNAPNAPNAMDSGVKPQPPAKDAGAHAGH